MKPKKCLILRSISLWILCLFFSSVSAGEDNLQKNNKVHIRMSLEKLMVNGSAKVLIAFSPKCPVCFGEIAQINQLSDITEIQKDSIDVILLFPDKFKVSEIKKFLKENKLTHIYWTRMPVKTLLNAGFSVTPEAKVFNAEGKLFYTGKVSNLYESIGRKRTVITQYYLQDAIKNIYETIDTNYITETVPVGCYISPR